MSTLAELSCRCGQVHGRVSNVSPKTVARVVCYCDDCQAFLHFLGRTELLDAHGGTDIVAVAPASLSFDRGEDLIVGLRLTPKGLHRWYSGCCRTPLGNTVGPAVPFVGIIAQTFETAAQRPDDLFGKPAGAVWGKYAVGGAPAGSTSINLRLAFRFFRAILGWRLREQAWPHPYFDRIARTPSHAVAILSRPEREALRPLCGPRPSIGSHRRP